MNSRLLKYCKLLFMVDRIPGSKNTPTEMIHHVKQAKNFLHFLHSQNRPPKPTENYLLKVAFNLNFSLILVYFLQECLLTYYGVQKVKT